MDYHVPVGAGVEKFYTFAQFYTVLAYSAAVLLTAAMTIRIEDRFDTGRKRAYLYLFMLAGMVFQISEIGLIMAPSGGAVRVWITIDSVALILLSRSVFLLCTWRSENRRSFRAGLILFTIETLIYGLLVSTHPFGLRFFEAIGFHRTTPGPLYRWFLAEAIAWITIGTLPLLSPGRKPVNRKARGTFITGSVVLSVTLYLHHALNVDFGAVILPTGVLVWVILWRRAIVRHNLLGLYLDSYESIIDLLKLRIFILSPGGRVLAQNGLGPEFPDTVEVDQAADIVAGLAPAADDPETTRFVDCVCADRISHEGQGRFSIVSGEARFYIQYALQPVRYGRSDIAWMLSLWDVTDDEHDIRALAETQANLQSKLDELQLYRDTGLYLDTERKRGALIDRVHEHLGAITRELVSCCDGALRPEVSEPDIERVIDIARRGVADVRSSVNRLKQLKEV